MSVTSIGKKLWKSASRAWVAVPDAEGPGASDPGAERGRWRYGGLSGAKMHSLQGSGIPALAKNARTGHPRSGDASRLKNLGHPPGEHIVRIGAFVTSIIFVTACVSVLPICLRSQDRGGTSLGTGATLIREVLSKTDASGSLEYWGQCNFHEAYPDFPKLRVVSGREGSAVGLLREIFSVDPEMRVSQDDEGKIRMIEEDVPSDVLDVRIHHILFTGEYHGPNAAIVTILNTPELRAFRKKHNLGPEAYRGGGGAGFGYPSEAFAPEKPRVLGELYDVTVRQALDYILQTFHGFWLYETCKTEAGRMVYLGFFENIPSRPK